MSGDSETAVFRAEEICRRLRAAVGDPKTELKYDSDYMFLVAVILSAQTTDVQVNKITSELFEKHKTIDDILALGLEQLTKKIRSIGLYKNKAKYVMETSAILKSKFQSTVPHLREDLESLPGVGRKTANVVLNTLFNKPAIAVDTHVLRVGNRLKLTQSSDPFKVEMDLERIIPVAHKRNISSLLILHGRYVCKAQKPNCANCILADLCSSYA
ncbi:MAG: endonuclease III [Holosporaceae bacterium]|jgi:endonuclease-3|nr:endonuclease III [Holosporaceae bacterium]